MAGIDIRAQIDSDTVKGLLLINGGGSVALLAFLPSILDKALYEPLASAILYGLLFFQLGLVSALFHNHLRRRCSIAYEKKKPKKRILWMEEPCVCHVSTLFMTLSYLFFIVAGIIIFCGGIKTIDKVQQSHSQHILVKTVKNSV